MPKLKHFPPWNKKIAEAKQKMGSLRDFYRETIEKHRKSLDSNNVRDVIDAFLLEEDEENFTVSQLMVIISDLFLAGSETTGKSLEWGSLFMVLHPDVSKH